jgi:DNA-binding NarL/FixJ family response regulator
MKCRILIADDHEIVRRGIGTFLTSLRPDWEICGEARDGEEAIAAVKRLTPDILVLDITMPGLSGLQAASEISKLDLGCRVLIFTMHESESLSAEVRATGARGYVCKSQAARDLIVAIDSLLGGGTFFGGKAEIATPSDWTPVAASYSKTESKAVAIAPNMTEGKANSCRDR